MHKQIRHLQFHKEDPFTVVTEPYSSSSINQKIEVDLSNIIDVSPDGRFILYCGRKEIYVNDRPYYLLDLHTKKNVFLSKSAYTRFLPDGNIAACSSDHIEIFSYLGEMVNTFTLPLNVHLFKKSTNQISTQNKPIPLPTSASPASKITDLKSIQISDNQSNSSKKDNLNETEYSISITTDGLRIVGITSDNTIASISLHSEGAHIPSISHDALPLLLRLLPSGDKGIWVDNKNRIIAFDVTNGLVLGKICAQFTIRSIKGIKADGNFYCLDNSNNIYLFTPEQSLKSSPRVTALQKYLINGKQGIYQKHFSMFCPWCRSFTNINNSSLFAIESVLADPKYHTESTIYPSLSLSAWSDIRLDSFCSECNAPVRFNPFLRRNNI